MLQFKSGWDKENDTVDIYRSAEGAAIFQGAAVDLNNDGKIAVSADKLKFMLRQEVKLVDPTFEERAYGIIQYHVKAGSVVTLFIPRVGNLLWTDSNTVTVPDPENAPVAKKDTFKIENGKFVKDDAGTHAECTRVIDAENNIYELRILKVD